MTKKLEWYTEKRKVNDLLPHSQNPRLMSDKQMSDLKKSLRQFNLVEIPAVDLDNKIIAGHQRVKALQLLGRGEEQIEVRVPNRELTKEEYDRYLIASNAVTGTWDIGKLKDFDFDFLLDIGFDPIELDKMWEKTLSVKEENFDVGKELKKITKPQTKLGDIVELGSHRLLCGDSTDPTVLKRLFGSGQAAMIYSDPVYNIGVDYNGGIGGKRQYGGDVNDRRTEEDYVSLIEKSLTSALAFAKPDTHVFYWCDQTYIWLVQTLYKKLGVENKRVCLWIKNNQNPTPTVAFNKGYEPCVYGLRGRPPLYQNRQDLNEILDGDTGTGNALVNDLDLWLSKRLPTKDYEHATTKPPTLHQKAIQRCTKPGDIIFDGFSGSGSTLIAGENLGRRVYAVELEPVFCDLTIKRFEKLTGQKSTITNHHEKVQEG